MQVLEDHLCLEIEQALSRTIFLCAYCSNNRKGKWERKKQNQTKQNGLCLAGELDIPPTWFRTIPPNLFSVTERNAIMKQGSLHSPQGQSSARGSSSVTRAKLSPGKAGHPLWTSRWPSTGLSPHGGWTHLLFSMPSPPWLLVVWWTKGHSCFNWLDFQLINSQITFAALLALNSRYGNSYKKNPFLSASETATQSEKLTPKRRATQKALQN